MLVAEDRADHIDLNFGCPVPKVTRKGGGAALPWKLDLFRDIVEARRAARPATLPADDQDAQGHRRRPPHLPRGRPHRRGRRASPRSRCTRAPPPSSTPAPPTGRRSRSSRRPSRASRCSATATSGGRRRAADGRARPAATASSSAAAASAGRGCSATSPPRSARGDRAGRSRARRSARSPHAFRRHAELLVEFFDDDEEPRLPRHPQARRLVLQGLPASAASLRAQPRAGRVARAARRPARHRSTADQPYPGEAAEGQRGRAGTPEAPVAAGPLARLAASSTARRTAPRSPAPSCTHSGG